MSYPYANGLHRRCAYCGAIEPQPNRPLTRLQTGLYRYLADFIGREGYAPSFEQIAEHFGYRSLATVHEHLVNLERKGWIRREYNICRSIECLVPLTDVPVAV